MSILAMFVALFSVVMIACASLVSVIASGTPSYFAGLLYDREPVVKHDHRIGAISLCDEDGSICTLATRTEPLQAIRCETLTDTPAIITPSYAGDDVKVMIPRNIGEPRDARGRFMPRYKA